MDHQFAKIVNSLHAKYEELMAMEPVTIDTAPRDTPVGGVYLFSKNGEHLYAGRTKRRIRDRLRDHVNATADDCPFAWRLAREETGRPPTWKKLGSQNQLLKDPDFRAAYSEAKAKIREMDVRFVAEADPLKQALLEIYVAVVTGAKHNDFATH
jgi:hypothetical protein